jgi:hypothetical protein
LVRRLAGRSDALHLHVRLAHGVLYGLHVLAALLADLYLFDDARLLLDDRLLSAFAHLERLLAECLAGSRTARRPALHVDVLLFKLNRLAHWLLQHAAIDANAALLHVALPDHQLLLRYGNGALRFAGRGRSRVGVEAALPSLLFPLVRALVDIHRAVAPEDRDRGVRFTLVVRGHRD